MTGSQPGLVRWDEKIAAIIDHTILSPTASPEEVRAACADARSYGFAAVVTGPYYTPIVVEELAGSDVRSCSVVSFPLGAHSARDKVEEAARLLQAGVAEVDMVMNISAFLSGNYEVVRDEVKGVAATCRRQALLKVIIETSYLGPEQIARATELCIDGGANFVKTSTGFAPSGAKVEDVRIMATAAAGRAGIKASGGIRTREFALELVKVGATRIGCSASLSVIAIGGAA